MLYFREHDWRLMQNASHFTAWLTPKTKTAADIHWDLRLYYVAGGAPWRRVQFWHRPSIILYLPCFRPPDFRTWRDLGRMNFWNPDQEDDDEFCGPGGWLDIEFTDRPKAAAVERSIKLDTIWRVAACDGARFTVELAGRADGFNDLLGAMPAVLPDGALAADSAAPDPGYWKGKAELYLVEEVPFGLVTVRVSRNSRDPIAHALGRAQSLLGVGEPEQIVVSDYSGKVDDKLPPQARIDGDLFVNLHYHGYYEI